MKIAIADNNNRKFTADIIAHFESLGHEVEMNMGANEKLAQWADIYYVDTWDNNIHYLWKLYHPEEHPTDVSRTENWNNSKKPRIIVRALDWEVWLGYVRDQRIIDWVDDIIVIAPHIEEELKRHAHFGDKIHLIRPGVNLEKFTLKKKQTNGRQIGMVLGDMWKYKNAFSGLDIFTTLLENNNRDSRYHLHIRGQHESGIYDPENFEYYIKSRGLEEYVTLYPRVDDMNEWYENLDYLLHPGQKEAFCYAVGEAMAKGLTVAINDFLGSHDMWRPEDIYTTNARAVSKLGGVAHDAGQKAFTGIPSVRKYIEDNYSAERMLSEYDSLFFK